MSGTFISNLSMSNISRSTTMKLQEKLVEAEKEAVTGRYADVGLTLGAETGRTISLRNEYGRLKAIGDSNSFADTRLSATQSSIDGLIETAQTFIESMVSWRDGSKGASEAQNLAKSYLQSLTDAMNTTVGGEFIFGGINIGDAPMVDYFQSGGSPAKTALDSAFLTTFGVTQDDPAASSILPADMETFLDTTFSALFDTAAWSSTWSNASSDNMRSRISTSQVIETGTNANEKAFRTLASAYSMVASLGLDNLNDETFETIANKAIELASNAIKDMGELGGFLGTAQERIANASDRNGLRLDLLTEQINDIETVDAYEASTRVNTLTTQIETAYTLTSRIKNLSFLNYM